jgi:nucleotide-binding universal stress UspA family protein
LERFSETLGDVLVPVDGSEHGFAALKLACSLTRRNKGTIFAVYVIEVARNLALDAEMAFDAEKAELVLQRSEQITDQLDAKIEGEILQARDAGHAIVDEAIERGVSAIILGVGFEKPLGEFEMDDNATYVMQHAPCKVIMLRAEAHEGQ